MSNSMNHILDKFIECLGNLERRIKRVTIDEVSFETYLQEIMEYKEEFYIRCQFEWLIDQIQVKKQISEILQSRILKLKNLPLQISDESEFSKNTSKSFANIQSDQGIRSILKQYINILKSNEVKLCELNQRINNNKQNVLQIQYMIKNKIQKQPENSILRKLLQQTKRIDKIVEQNLLINKPKFQLIKKLSEIEESLQQKTIYVDYRHFRKWQKQVKRIFENVKLIIEKYMNIKNMNIHQKKAEIMFEENTSYSCSPQSPKKSVLTQRLNKIISEMDFLQQVQMMEEVKPSLDIQYNISGKKKQKKIITKNKAICYNGCPIF